jgi:hypothetical protein
MIKLRLLHTGAWLALAIAATNIPWSVSQERDALRDLEARNAQAIFKFVKEHRNIVELRRRSGIASRQCDAVLSDFSKGTGIQVLRPSVTTRDFDHPTLQPLNACARYWQEKGYPPEPFPDIAHSRQFGSDFLRVYTPADLRLPGSKIWLIFGADTDENYEHGIGADRYTIANAEACVEESAIKTLSVDAWQQHLGSAHGVVVRNGSTWLVAGRVEWATSDSEGVSIQATRISKEGADQSCEWRAVVPRMSGFATEGSARAN